jgi:hypothetical protein
MSAWYGTVPSQLQYGCSTSIRATLGPLTLCELLESATYEVLAVLDGAVCVHPWEPRPQVLPVAIIPRISKRDHVATGSRVPRSGDECG